jgi:hypothetical protein
LLVIDRFLLVLIIEGFIEFEGLWDLVMLLLVGLGLADVVTEPEPLVSRDWRKGEKKPTRHKDHP